MMGTDLHYCQINVRKYKFSGQKRNYVWKIDNNCIHLWKISSKLKQQPTKHGK